MSCGFPSPSALEKRQAGRIEERSDHAPALCRSIAPMTRSARITFRVVRPVGRCVSDEDLTNHVAVDVGQAIVAALEAVSETLVVEAEQVENGGVQVVDVNRVLDDVV